ncbi:MAG TPA: hypothetical protein DDY71_11155 [Spirochaetia bacterium]|nr:hypothetical protein [Spirochaetia bacterium]
MKIWKMGYFPFTMGGNLYRPIATEFPDEKLGISYDLGLGFEGYLIVDSKNRTFVVEKISGAIVGSTIEEVRKDIVDANDLVEMQDQVIESTKIRDNAELMSFDDFWKGIH